MGSISRTPAIFLAVSLLAGCATLGADPQERLVDVRIVDPRILVDIRYATPDNFTHHAIYPSARCLLRENVARRLAWVESDLSLQGIGLKVWDCYRPKSVQLQLWKVLPDPRYVADPRVGSRHNRGAAVDITLVDLRSLPEPRELEMPTNFDDFSPAAHRDYRGASPQALFHRQILQEAMQRRGFRGLSTEWWHFDAPGWNRYPVLDVPFDAVR